MVLKNIYYASNNRLYRDGKLGNLCLTKYHVSREDEKKLMETVNVDARTRGKLLSIDSISEKEYIRWCTTTSREDWYKQKDYENICQSLSTLGLLIRSANINSQIILELVNQVPYFNNKSYRKLKDFEERALLNGLNGILFKPFNSQP